MASEVEIRDAIVAELIAKMAIFTPPPVVIGRDILDVHTSGWMNVLRDQDGLGLIHAITVTQNGQMPTERMQGGADYDEIFDVWQWAELKTGTDALNSENQSSNERKVMIEAFKWGGAFPANHLLRKVKPIEFPQGSIATRVTDYRGQVRIAKGILRVGNIYGC